MELQDVTDYTGAVLPEPLVMKSLRENYSGNTLLQSFELLTVIYLMRLSN